MLGCVTPKWSIRLRKILNDVAIAASVSVRRMLSTSSFVLFGMIVLRSGLMKIADNEPPFDASA